MLKIGIIGCGKIAEKHLIAYSKMQGVHLVVSDIVPKGKIIAKKYGAAWCNDPAQLLADKTVTAIDICIPTPAHKEYVIHALHNNKHVFCEKPIARTSAEAKEIATVLHKTDRILMVGYLYRFHPAFIFSKKILVQNIIGRPHMALFRLGGRGSHKAWKHKREAGGGACNEMLVHMVDLVLWYLGDFQNIHNLYQDVLLKQRLIEGKTVIADAEDIIVLNIKTKGGCSVLCESDLITPSYMNYVEVHGDNGSLWFSILNGFPTILYCKEARGTYSQGKHVLSFPETDLFAAELNEFVDYIRKEKCDNVNSLEDSLKVMELVEGIRI